MRDPKLYLKDILEAMDSIELFIGEMDIDEFKEDDKTSSAVIRKPPKTSFCGAENLQFSSI